MREQLLSYWNRNASQPAATLDERRGILKSLLAAGFAGLAPSANAAVPPSQSHAASPTDPVDWVDPNIGGIGHLLTSRWPEVQVPHGVAIIAPVVAKDVTDIYLATTMQGFSLGASVLTAATGTTTDLPLPIVSDWDHDHDVVKPYYGSYRLESYGIRVEYTAQPHAAYFRIVFPAGSPGVVALSPIETAAYTPAGPSSFSAVETLQGVVSYLHVETTPPLRAVATRMPGALLLEFDGTARTVEVRAGLSFISAEQAKRNLDRDLGGRNFEAARFEARKQCNSLYNKIRIKGGTDRERRLFYSCLYRSCQFMMDITEDGQYRGPFDRKVHSAGDHNFYIQDNLWDTYRCRHPLQLIIEPKCNTDMLQSYVRMYEESGKMPQFPYMRGDLLYMNGNHAASMFYDAYAKGQRDFDLAKAYEGLRKVATAETMLADTRGPATDLDRFYYEHGFYPGLHKGEAETVQGVNRVMRRQSVSVTLDAAYDDWCLSGLAKALGKSDDAEYFAKRGRNYRNVFDKSTGFMAPRDANGEFIPGLNPKWSGGQAGRDYYTECNGWVNTFLVQHDIHGLIELIGGREQFIHKLDSLFAEGYDKELKFVFLSQFPDSTGLIGQYPQGNEPAFHIPYLYNYAGAPWKTQKFVRQIMRTWYQDQPLGLPGDDDNGATSSWYVLSAMGFYPVCPGRTTYALGSPIFEECEIDVAGGKTFRIVAPNVSALNKYIQSATLNGKPLHQPWVDHADLLAGGTLTLHMGPEPNKAWGSHPEAAPPEHAVV